MNKKIKAFTAAVAIIATYSLVGCTSAKETSNNTDVESTTQQVETSTSESTTDITEESSTTETETTTQSNSDADVSGFEGFFKLTYDEGDDWGSLIDSDEYIYVDNGLIVQIYDIEHKAEILGDNKVRIIDFSDGETEEGEFEYTAIETDSGKSKNIIATEGMDFIIDSDGNMYMASAGEYQLTGNDYLLLGDYDESEAEEYAATIVKIDDDNFKIVPKPKEKQKYVANVTRDNSKDNIIEILKTEGKYLLKPKHNEELAQKMSNTYDNGMKEFKVNGQTINLDAADIDMLNSMIQCVDKKDVSKTKTDMVVYIEIVLENRDILYISSNSGEYIGTYYEDATRKKTLINLPETLVDYAQDIADSVK